MDPTVQRFVKLQMVLQGALIEERCVIDHNEECKLGDLEAKKECYCF